MTGIREQPTTAAMTDLQRLCERTFDWRRQQAWPPLPLRPMDGWGLAHADARAETEIDGSTAVLPNVEEARSWLEQTIGVITSAPRAHPAGRDAFQYPMRASCERGTAWRSTRWRRSVVTIALSPAIQK